MENFTHPIAVIPHFFYLEYVGNGGAAWNLLDGHRYLLCFFGFFTLLVLFISRKKFRFHESPRHLSFALIVGGACGNLYDRMRLGYVVDFIDVHLPLYRWPTFNFADASLCIGLLFLAILEIIERKCPRRHP
jgi:signal peptidase II